MKKYIALFLSTLFIFTNVFAADSLVESSISKLAYIINNNFEELEVGTSITSTVQGLVKSGVEVENGNKYLKLLGDSAGDNMFDIPFATPIKGSYIISFDARVDSLNYRQMPMLLGMSDAGLLSGLGYIATLDSGEISDGSKSISSYKTGEWNNYILSIDTYANVMNCAIDGKVVSRNIPTMGKISTINSLRFLLRGSVGIDIDNLMVYEGKFKSEVKLTTEPEVVEVEPMPIRKVKAIVQTKINIYHPKGEITIDGNLNEDDWKGEAYSVSKPVAGESEARASFVTMWDVNGLYIGGWAADSTPFNDSISAPWDDDAFEVFIDGNNAKGEKFDNDDRQYLYSYKNTALYNDGKTLRFKADGVNFAQKDTAEGYTMEMFIPFSAFSSTTITAGNGIGFDIAYDDDSNGGGRNAQFTWAGTSTNSQKPTDYGEVVLTDGYRVDNVSEFFKAVNERIFFFVDSPLAMIGTSTVPIDFEDNEVVPILENDRTYVPLRFLGESLGCKVEYDGVENRVIMTKGDIVVTNIIGSNELYVNGALQQLDTPTMVINDRTMLPLRGVANAFNKDVQWLPAGLIIVGSNSIPSDDIIKKIISELGSGV